MRFNDFALENNVVSMTEEEFLKGLALESAITDNVIYFFREGFPSLVNKLKSYSQTLSFPSLTQHGGQADFAITSTIDREVEKRYLNYRDVQVQIPEGFVGEFLPYVQELKDVGSNLYEQTHKLLSEYRFVISSIITNKEQLTSLKDLSQSYARATAAREELDKRLAKYFTNDTRSRARLISVVPTVRDSRELGKSIKDLEKYVNKKELKNIQDSVNAVVASLSILENQLQKEDVKDISPKVVKNIALGAYELAKYVDSIVVYYYAVISITVCVKSFFEKVKTFE